MGLVRTESQSFVVITSGPRCEHVRSKLLGNFTCCLPRVGSNQRFHFGTQFAIRAANQVQIGWPVLRRYPERFFQNLFRPLPALRTKNLAHKLGGNGKEMSAALPVGTAQPDQAEVRLVTTPPYLQQLRDLAWRLVLHRGFSRMGNVPGSVA